MSKLVKMAKSWFFIKSQKRAEKGHIFLLFSVNNRLSNLDMTTFPENIMKFMKYQENSDFRQIQTGQRLVVHLCQTRV